MTASPYIFLFITYASITYIINANLFNIFKIKCITVTGNSLSIFYSVLYAYQTLLHDYNPIVQRRLLILFFSTSIILYVPQLNHHRQDEKYSCGVRDKIKE
jgi:hypothetical protein